MGTVSAIVVVCVLLISAAVTLILILVTVPSDSEDPNEQPSTFQPYSHTNRAYEIHLPTRHSSPSPVDNNSSVSAVHNETISPLDSPSIAGPVMVLNSLNSTAIKTPSEEPEASIITQKPKMIASEHSTTTVKPLTASKFIAKTTTTSSLLQVTGEIATTRKRDFVTLTLRYESKLQHAELKSKARKIDMDGVETSKLELEREVGLPPEHKIIGIAFEHELLYVGTTDGKIRVWNPATGEQVEERLLGEKVDRLAVTENGQVITVNGQQISLYDVKVRRFNAEIPFRGKAITINGSDVYVLSKSNDAIAVLNDQLQLSHQIHFVNDAHDTCNFILASRQFLYVSCQSAILKITKSGQMMKRIGVNKGTFSLGITFDDHNRLIAVVRGQPLLRIFQDDKLLRNAASGDEGSAIWSEVLYEGTRLHVVDYLANKLKTFRYPPDLI